MLLSRLARAGIERRGGRSPQGRERADVQGERPGGRIGIGAAARRRPILQLRDPFREKPREAPLELALAGISDGRELDRHAAPNPPAGRRRSRSPEGLPRLAQRGVELVLRGAVDHEDLCDGQITVTIGENQRALTIAQRVERGLGHVGSPGRGRRLASTHFISVRFF